MIGCVHHAEEMSDVLPVCMLHFCDKIYYTIKQESLANAKVGT